MRPINSVRESCDRLLKKLTQKVSALTGWRRYGLAFFSGVGATLAMAPYYLLPLMIVAYSILLCLWSQQSLDDQPRPLRRAFFTGWAFGTGYFLSGLYWMGFAFLVRADQFAWMIPIAIPAFAGFLGLFYALPGVIFVKARRALWPGSALMTLQHALLFAVCISVFEYLRGHILTGLPWNLAGQAMTGIIAGAQTVSVYGVYGLGFLVVSLSALPVTTLQYKKEAVFSWFFSLFGFAILFFVGFVLLLFSPTTLRDDIRISIVQPNITQKDKVNPALANQNFNKLINLSMSGTGANNHPNPADYIIWPENAISWIDQQPVARDIIKRSIAAKTIILAGSVRQAIQDLSANQYYNTLAILEDRGRERNVTRYYDKHHLVPFGEYLPLKGLLNSIGLSQLAPVGDGFTAGVGPQTIQIGPAAFAPLICYETIFPGQIYPKDARPEWLVTVTNDAWFGDGAGPKQHLDQARLRAIESGLPMVRSANTGISAVIDANGRILKKIALYQDGVIDMALPASNNETVYARFGNWLYAFMLIIASFLLWSSRDKRP